MKKVVSLLIVAMLLVSIFVTGCDSGGNTNAQGNNNESDSKVEEKTDTNNDDKPKKTEIVLAQKADIVSLDPHATNDSPSANLTRQIYSSLVRTNVNMEYEGDLAESWKSLSPTEWEFKLRQGVKWHDGSDFKASDVKFSIERQQQGPQVKHLVNMITEVKVIDDYTVVIVTDEPCGPLLANLAHSASRIVPEKACTEYGDKFAEHPTGTGPMKFVEWVPGDRVVLERNEDYFEGLPATERLVMRVIPEGTSRTIALETGEVDLILDVEPIDKEKIESNSDLKLYEEMSNRTEWLSLNNKKAPFDNKLVRQAINHAIDKESVIEVATDGRGMVANTVIGPTVLGYNPNVKVYEYDPEKAKELLAQAGFPDGFTTTLWSSGDVRNRAAEVIQSNLAEVGITAEIELMEWGAYLDKTSAGEHDMHLLGWSNLTADGDGGMYPNFHSTSQGASGNRSFFENAEVDRLLEEGRVETDFDKRPKYYEDAQDIIMEEAAMVPLYFQPTEVGARADLKGVELHPGSLHRFHMLHY